MSHASLDSKTGNSTSCSLLFCSNRESARMHGCSFTECGSSKFAILSRIAHVAKAGVSWRYIAIALIDQACEYTPLNAPTAPHPPKAHTPKAPRLPSRCTARLRKAFRLGRYNLTVGLEGYP